MNNKSMFFVSLPKSGTVYTWYSLSDMTGLELPQFHLLEGWDEYNTGRDFSCPDLYACGDYNTQLLRPEQMKLFMSGYVFGAHMQASYHNMKILEETGIDRATVLLRDPRDAFVSWVHHLNKLGPDARNYHSKIYHIPRGYYDWSLDRQFDFQVRSFLPVPINWVEGWLDYYASPDRKVDILFVLYDELKRNPEAYIKRIVEFHEIDDVDYSKLIVPEMGKMHFRKGEHGSWATDLSPENQKLACDLLQDRIPESFDAAARAHPSYQIAVDLHAKRDFVSSAKAILDVIVQFPNSQFVYDLLFNNLDGAGLDANGLKQEVAKRLEGKAVEDFFRYQYELIAECSALVHQLENV